MQSAGLWCAYGASVYFPLWITGIKKDTRECRGCFVGLLFGVMQCPFCECCSFCEKFSIFVMSKGLTPVGKHIWKCFRTIPNRESDSFQRRRDGRTALISCMVMWTMHPLCVPHTVQVWGIASFIFFGFCQSLLLDKRNQLHTFFFCLPCHWGCGRTNHLLYVKCY